MNCRHLIDAHLAYIDGLSAARNLVVGGQARWRECCGAASQSDPTGGDPADSGAGAGAWRQGVAPPGPQRGPDRARSGLPRQCRANFVGSRYHARGRQRQGGGRHHPGRRRREHRADLVSEFPGADRGALSPGAARDRRRSVEPARQQAGPPPDRHRLAAGPGAVARGDAGIARQLRHEMAGAIPSSVRTIAR